MRSTKILNRKEIKTVQSFLTKRFGIAKENSPFDDMVWLKNAKDRVFVTNRDTASLDTQGLRVNALGLYIGEFKHDELRLSVEGAQRIGKLASENIIELTKGQAAAWLRGEDLENPEAFKGAYLIKYKSDILGATRAVEGKLINFVPKNRRLKTDGVGL